MTIAVEQDAGAVQLKDTGVGPRRPLLYHKAVGQIDHLNLGIPERVAQLRAVATAAVCSAAKAVSGRIPKTRIRAVASPSCRLDIFSSVLTSFLLLSAKASALQSRTL